MADLNDELRPYSQFQVYLVRKIANCLWRSRRAIMAETPQINNQLERVDSDLKYESLLNAFKNIEDSPDQDALALANKINSRSIPDIRSSLNILRYEMRLDRQLTRAFKLLKILQMDTTSNQHRSCSADKNNDETNPFE